MILITYQGICTLRYVVESDPKEDLEDYEDEEREDGPVDYPMDRGDDGDDDDDDSSGDDTDDEEEEEEHLASADSVIVIPTDELVSPSEGTGQAEVERLLAMPTPSPSPHTSLLPPSAGERLARLASTQALNDAVTDVIPSLPLPPPIYIPPLPLYIPPPVDRRDAWVDPAKTVPEIEPMTVEEDQVYAHEFQLQAHQTQLQLQGTLIQTHHQLHKTRFQMQQTEIAELRETNRRRQAHIVETLRVIGHMRREMGDLQAELLALREQPRRA
nr:hypothetical protein [Tanacetum cinerariifolium]